MVCEKNFCNYNPYYVTQAQEGGNLDISYYRGVPYQSGYGRVSNYAKRYGIPVMKYLLKQGFYAGKDIFKDLTEGKKFAQSAKIHLKRKVGTSLKSLGEHLEQSGSGLRKKPKLNKKQSKTLIKIKRKLKSKVKSRKVKNTKSTNKFNKDIFK